jgi:hypothetical protein
MCAPVAAQIGFQALAIGAQYIGASMQADAQAKFQNERLEQTEAAAAVAARDQYMGMLRRQSQVREAAAQETQTNLQRSMQAAASSRVAAAAGGVSGVSAEETTREIGRQYSDWAASRATNLTWQEQQIRASMDGIRAQQIGRVQGAIGSPIAGPSPFATLMQMGAAGFDAYNTYNT